MASAPQRRRSARAHNASLAIEPNRSSSGGRFLGLNHDGTILVS
jgi:hypothetical protein